MQCHGGVQYIVTSMMIHAATTWLISLLVAVGSKCGAFATGYTCTPNSKDVTILTNATEDECRGACEAQNKDGCCWHSPSLQLCQYAIGIRALPFRNDGSRSAANCTLPPPPPPPPTPPPPPPPPRPQPEQLHIAYGETDHDMVVAWASLGWPVEHKKNQNGAKSGFEMCFGPTTLGAGAKPRLKSSIQKVSTPS